MKNLLKISLILCASSLSAQFSNATEFISFARKDFPTKKSVLSQNSWELKTSKKDYAGEVALYQLNIEKSRVWNVALRKVKSPNSGKTIYDTELKVPNDEFYMMNEWMGQLLKEGYEFEVNQYRGESIYKGKDWRIIVTMKNNGYEALTKINVLVVK
ncbi:hypothetical protein VUJ46_19010 [Chryseobacterium sp. MYb264]|uniref:hypothetical protein n=1 Tax=Chryseobacterium sp. MYb264 TaxID=2745153 RepID=UPI002E14C52E|nr:hypothetical protein VUJ46_19010 [Chryseobacterium sp. MYb264]